MALSRTKLPELFISTSHLPTPSLSTIPHPSSTLPPKARYPPKPYMHRQRLRHPPPSWVTSFLHSSIPLINRHRILPQHQALTPPHLPIHLPPLSLRKSGKPNSPPPSGPYSLRTHSPVHKLSNPWLSEYRIMVCLTWTDRLAPKFLQKFAMVLAIHIFELGLRIQPPWI